MLKMRPYAPSNRIAVRDSIDEEMSDDVEDDVFIRDGRSHKVYEENGLKQPLMAPRRKSGGKQQNQVPIMKKHRRCWRCCEPFCYGLAALTILIALIFLAAFILTMFPIPLQKIKLWLKKEPSINNNYQTNFSNQNVTEFVPCTQISVERIWSRIIPRINSESPLRKVDINGDEVHDIVFGYSVDDNIQFDGEPLPKCKPSSGLMDEIFCKGGVIALNGKNGEPLWQKWTPANVFSLYCNVDIDRDGYVDCVASGRGGMILAINGRNGNTIWNFHEVEVETNSPIIIDLYTINSVRDLDGDGIPEVLAAHMEERSTSRAGHIKLISGKNGKVIRTIPTPFREEVFVPLQVITQEDGTELLMIITGGQSTPGGIYTIRLLSLMQYTSEKEFDPLFKISNSGFMVPAVLTDITGDHIEDIIVSAFNSTVYAFDGHNFTMLWNFSFPASESISSIVPGHFDHDNVTDFMIKYNTGPGFPLYYYSQTTILSGINGVPLLDSMMTDSGGPHSLLGGISISQTFGGDFFLHWQLQCRGKFDAKDAYEFIPESDVILQSRADTCLLRYNTTTMLKLYAITRHVEPPGAVIFSSDDLDVHLNATQDQPIKLNSVSPLKHPKLLKKLLVNKMPTGRETVQNSAKFFNKDVKKKYNIKKMDESVLNDNIENALEEIPNDVGIPNPYEAVNKPYAYSPYNAEQRENDFKDYENDAGRNQEEYEILYNEDQRNARPIHLRTKYPSNRGVRSDLKGYETSQENNNETIEVEPILATNMNRNKKSEPLLNLWDLEMEKEEDDAIKETTNYENRQKREDKVDSTTTDNKPLENNDDYFLSSISSTGVLVKSLDSSPSSIDFLFILNIRESETFPPLFLPKDLNCVQEKMSAYKSYTSDDLNILEKQFLKQCLRARLTNIAPSKPKFESQMIVTRISISCTCRALEPGEVCSKLEKFENQKWTEYMGNQGNGLYRN